MFGGSKPAFGTTPNATSFGSFSNTAATTPFGQSAFGKPAAPAFGNTSTFAAQPAQPSLFGAAATPAQPAGGMFGASTSSAFGSTAAAPTSFGAFSQPQQPANIFGSTPAASNTSLFGQAATPAFGAAKPATLGMTAFGQTPAAQPTSSLFGQTAAATSASAFGSFGQAAPTTTNVFGSGTASAFAQPQPGAVASGVNPGSAVAKYQPTMGTDTLMKGGQPNSVSTKQHCITAMKEYELKSLEELRMEDYLSSRKGPQAGSTAGAFGFGSSATAAQPPASGLFGSTVQPSAGLFGQAVGQENKSLFGASAFGQPATTSAFGAPAQQNSFLQKPFGATAGTPFAQPAADASNPFGAKPAFGQGASMFGQAPATSAAPAFGQANTGFGTFGSTAGQQQQQTSLFGSTPAADPNKSAFGLGTAATAANTGFGFGSPATSTAGGGLFGAKPATSFAAPAFGATSTPSTGFGNFGMTNSVAAGGGLFNNAGNMNKPATTGFGGFGATAAAPLNFNAGNTGGSLFGNAAKPGGGLFGGTSTLGGQTQGGPVGGGGGLFGGGTGAFGTGGGSLGGGGAFASLGGNTSMAGGMGMGAQQQMGGGGMMQLSQQPIHQQILARVTSPYGDTPIFKDLRNGNGVDATRATNPAAQQAVMDMKNKQFKINIHESRVPLKVKATSSITRKSLFEGLEEFDGSVEGFNIKPNARRLVIKPKDKPTEAPNLNSSVNSSGPHSIHAAVGRSSRESFNGAIPNEPSPVGPASSSRSPRDSRDQQQDTSRRESWLHPKNLEMVRQRNIQTGMDQQQSPLNSTLNELVPRKPLETYRPCSTQRLSVSTIHENPFEDQSQSASAIARRDTFVSDQQQASNESTLSNRTHEEEAALNRSRLAIEAAAEADLEPHPTGIVLRRAGYYTIPSLDDLKSYLAEDGSCVVPNFTIGREGYGNVYFGKEMDVAGLNLDELVHFRNKEIIIYPDDDNKPAINQGLNREAQVTLDQVWPVDKTQHVAVKDAQRLIEMDWEGKLRRVCDKNDTRFIEYRPETGSWVFRVKHFSKYGLEESDEECSIDKVPTDPKKPKMSALEAHYRAAAAAGAQDAAQDKMTLNTLRHAQRISEDAARSLDPKALVTNVASHSFRPMDDSAEFMLMDKTQFFQAGAGTDFSMFEAPRQQQPQTIVSPTALLAKEVAGNEPHKMQLMKSSLFVDDDDIENEVRVTNKRFQSHRHLSQAGPNAWTDMGASETSSPYDFGHTTPGLPVSSSASVASLLQSDETSSVATGSIFAEKPKPTALVVPSKVRPFKFVTKPKVAPVKVFGTTVPLVRSLLYEHRLKWVADLGFYKGRSLKLTFGPHNTLMVPQTLNNVRRAIEDGSVSLSSLTFMPRAANDLSPVLFQFCNFNMVHGHASFRQTIVPHLEVQLAEGSAVQIEDSQCPWLQAGTATQLIAKHLREAVKLRNLGALEEYGVSVWSLLYALWGRHEELSDDSNDANSHHTVMCRRNLFSEWLENTLVGRDLLTKKVSSHTYLDHMVDLLSCHRVSEACDLALNYDDAHLALTLAQLGSGAVVRMLLEEQLFAWQQSKSDKYIHLNRLKMYMMAAGVNMMQSSQGVINLMEDNNWLTVVGMELWYFREPTSSITDALIEYDKAFQSEECFAEPPSPTYKGVPTAEERKKPVYDLRYHLLQLYSKRMHPLEETLNPITHTVDPMDFRLSWLLLQTLWALGYRHCSPLTEAQLTVDFASQLENEGLWQWGIFVLLHIESRDRRERAVQQMLLRNVSVLAQAAHNDEERFIVEQLGVPKTWVDYAKAVRAGSLGKRHLQAKHLLTAKHWAEAHEIIFEYIAPDAIINGQTDYLHRLLIQFEDTEGCSSGIRVPNWANQGQIFLEFIDISSKFKQIRNVQNIEDIKARWENLKPQLSELCSRISLLPCPTAKHRLCQTEISQSLNCLVQGMCIVSPQMQSSAVLKVALERLPMPQEFLSKELRTLLDELLEDLEHKI
ncbi:nuclear pore complex protein Nup98-Nup96 [Drosophila pseudoobscura]|uniref:Nuclear pore complex protein Nup98-Nup96 n=1 Tax=Drosophila pseudoobscura pseudoobscura TaxID=46245 RepID=A0A6I8UPH1_DROPS|nr:nuclear pore complex protein Nup98-Nup96 [Drosophila pseudoobscura]